jgi:hypothetical protein
MCFIIILALFARMYLLLDTIGLCHSQLVQITHDMICGCTIGIPRRVKMIRGSGCICHFLRPGEVLVKPLPTTKGRVPQFSTDITTMITVGIVGVAVVTNTPIVAWRATTTTLATRETTIAITGTTILLLMATAMCSSVGNHLILLSLVLQCLLRGKSCLSVKEAQVKRLRTDRISHTVNLLN